MKKSFLFILLLLILVVSACSKPDEKIVGKWEDNLLGMASYDFKSDGKVTIEVDGETTKGEYKTKGNKITIEANGEKAEAEYKIDGDILTLKPENEEALEFARVTDDKKSVAANTKEDKSKEKESDEKSSDDESKGDPKVPTWVSNDLELTHVTDLENVRVTDVYADDKYVYILLKEDDTNNSFGKYYLTVFEGQKQLKKDIPLNIKTMPEQQGQTVGFSKGKIYNKVVYNSHKSDKAREEASFLSEEEGLYVEMVSFNKDGLLQNEVTVLYDGDKFLDNLWDVGIIDTTQGLGIIKYHKFQMKENAWGGGLSSEVDVKREIILVNEPSKSFEIVDKEQVLPDSSFVFYDIENSLLYHASKSGSGQFQGVNILDNSTGEPIYEGGEDKDLGYLGKIDNYMDKSQLTFLFRDSTNDMPSIVRVDSDFLPIGEVFTPTTTHDYGDLEDVNTYICSPETAIIWKSREYERKPSIIATIMKLDK